MVTQPRSAGCDFTGSFDVVLGRSEAALQDYLAKCRASNECLS
jgi:hypothetical protein